MKILSVCLTFLILIIAVCCARVMENMDNYPRSRYGSMDFSNDLDGGKKVFCNYIKYKK